MRHEQDWIASIREHAERLNSDWVAMRRHLHQNPELSNHEFQTTEYLVTAFERLGLPTHVSGEGRGLTADLVSATELANGRCIAIRGDIDALPIQDSKLVDYRSNN